MGVGAVALLAVAAVTGRLAVLRGFGDPQWIAGIYLGVGGGALAFILWVMALERATPTRVANTMTVNPSPRACSPHSSSASRSPLNLIIGLVAVFAGDMDRDDGGQEVVSQVCGRAMAVATCGSGRARNLVRSNHRSPD